MAKEKKSYPMLSVTAWHKLRQHSKKKIPSSITDSYLASILGVSELSAKVNIFAPLKKIGFIGDGNKANSDMIVEFRDDNKYPELCKKLIQLIYPDELIDAFPDSSSDKSKIQNWFMTTGVGQAAAKRAASFYYELLDANPNREVKKMKNSTSKIDKAKKTEKSTKAYPKDTMENQKESPFSNLNRRFDTKSNMTINLNIQLTVPETTDEEVYNKFFEAMKKHLLS